jgi:hypothetical protein
VGVFYRRGPDPNAVLDRILLSAPGTAGEEVHAGEASEGGAVRHLRGVSAMRGGPIRNGRVIKLHRGGTHDSR